MLNIITEFLITSILCCLIVTQIYYLIKFIENKYVCNKKLVKFKKFIKRILEVKR